MSSSPSSANPSLLKTPSRKRTHEPEDELYANEAKRRRSSFPYGLLHHTDFMPATQASPVYKDIRDRFIPTLTTTEPFYPINRTSPRSSRLGRALGYAKRRLLSFNDDTPTKRQLPDPTFPLRTHLSQSLALEKIVPSHTYSAAKHGQVKPDRVLDSGPMDDFPPHPCAWSSVDMIAAVIRGRVFTHSMDTNSVSRILDYGVAQCVKWTSGSELAVGHNWGGTVLVDARTTKTQRYFMPVISFPEICAHTNVSRVNALAWSRERGLLGIGRANGAVAYYDPRVERPVKNEPGEVVHSVLGISWSPDGLYLASGHRSGVVRCTDWRANKAFDLKAAQRKTAHRKAVKSLTWAPWNPHLLATGGSTSDHTIRIWSISNFDTTSSGPVHTLSLSSDISSLHFSPHTTELLSTHGEAVPNLLRSHSTPRLRRRSINMNMNSVREPSAAPSRHALLVHSYPSLQRVHSVLDAHAEPIIDSVLAPDGTRVMTFGEDETLRVWTVWGARKHEKSSSLMNQYGIR
ncbi:WD40-repeat-containing domain protein [Gautieria morchelliformis]|nr:WD40-repeat-containing domain protein [Gautieria morchelliformis]